jgi:peptidoglycan/xylan/chitin deacetylase (PgdA/CDA1 family)
MYHSLDETGSPISASPGMLVRHLEALESAGYTVLPLGEALDRLTREPRLRLAALTFDDGYASVHSHGLPLMAARGWGATVFAISRYLGRDNQWPGQASFAPRLPLLSWTQLEDLAEAGWEIGAHTRTHPDLTQLSSVDLEDEVRGGKADLEDRLGRSVNLFAYPCGLYDARVLAAARCHYAAACTTDMGCAGVTSDRHRLERLEMWYFAQPGLNRLFATRLMDPYVALCRAARRRHSLGARARQTQEAA